MVGVKLARHDDLKIDSCRVVFLCVTLIFDCHRIEPTQLAFIILGASMAALALMILVVAVLATGATRHEVYRSSGGRVGGRVGNRNLIGADT